MSRFEYLGDYDHDGPDTSGLWAHSKQQALSSKRGLQRLREVEAALLALPAPRLIAGALATEECEVCAVGAWAKVQLAQGKTLRHSSHDRVQFSAISDLVDPEEHHFHDAYDTAEFGRANGLGYCLAWMLAEQNDEGPVRETPEQRHERVLSWVRAKIAANPHSLADAKAEVA